MKFLKAKNNDKKGSFPTNMAPVPLHDDMGAPNSSKRGRKILNSLKCAAPGCTVPKRDSMLPDEGEEMLSYGDYHSFDKNNEDRNNKDRQAAVERKIDSALVKPETKKGSDDYSVPLIVVASASFDYSDTTSPSFDILVQPSYDEAMELALSNSDSDVAQTLESLNYGRQEDHERMVVTPERKKDVGRMLDSMVPPTNILIIAEDDENGVSTILQSQSRSELDYVWNGENLVDMSLLSEADKDEKRYTQHQNMEEIMEAAKNRRGRIEHAQNEKAKEVIVLASPAGDVDILMKRIDKLRTFLQNDETTTVSSSSGLNISLNPNNLSPRAAVSLVQRLTPDRGPPPNIQPSISYNLTTRPFFWRSHPGPPRRTSQFQKKRITPIPQVHQAYIENPPAFINSVALTSSQSLVALAPRKNGHTGNAASTMPTISDPSRPPLSPSKFDSKTGSKAAIKTRFDDSFIPPTTSDRDMHQMVGFPDIPTNATSYSADDFHWTSSGDSQGWSADRNNWAGTSETTGESFNDAGSTYSI
jgi:hypothetical protein